MNGFCGNGFCKGKAFGELLQWKRNRNRKKTKMVGKLIDQPFLFMKYHFSIFSMPKTL
jgi:hypothetical protein